MKCKTPHIFNVGRFCFDMLLSAILRKRMEWKNSLMANLILLFGSIP